jgi:hypothetical protein
VATSRQGLTWCHCAGRGSTVAMIIVRQLSCPTRHPSWSSPSSPSFRGVVPIVGSHLWSLFAWSLCGAESHDPDRWGRGTPPVRKVSSSRPLSWIPSCSGWDRIRVRSVRIQTVGTVPVFTTMRCYLIGATWRWDGARLDRGDCRHIGP